MNIVQKSLKFSSLPTPQLLPKLPFLGEGKLIFLSLQAKKDWKHKQSCEITDYGRIGLTADSVQFAVLPEKALFSAPDPPAISGSADFLLSLCSQRLHQKLRSTSAVKTPQYI